jgi:hypothetical protein
MVLVCWKVKNYILYVNKSMHMFITGDITSLSFRLNCSYLILYMLIKKGGSYGALKKVLSLSDKNSKGFFFADTGNSSPNSINTHARHGLVAMLSGNAIIIADQTIHTAI